MLRVDDDGRRPNGRRYARSLSVRRHPKFALGVAIALSTLIVAAPTSVPHASASEASTQLSDPELQATADRVADSFAVFLRSPAFLNVVDLTPPPLEPIEPAASVAESLATASAWLATSTEPLPRVGDPVWDAYAVALEQITLSEDWRALATAMASQLTDPLVVTAVPLFPSLEGYQLDVALAVGLPKVLTYVAVIVGTTVATIGGILACVVGCPVAAIAAVAIGGALIIGGTVAAAIIDTSGSPSHSVNIHQIDCVPTGCLARGQALTTSSVSTFTTFYAFRGNPVRPFDVTVGRLNDSFNYQGTVGGVNQYGLQGSVYDGSCGTRSFMLFDVEFKVTFSDGYINEDKVDGYPKPVEVC